MPRRYAELFASHVLHTHRGYDIGALPLARKLAKAFSAPLFTGTVTRLLVDLNRSPHHTGLFSETARGLPEAERGAILERYYLPYRRQVEAQIAQVLAKGSVVVHLSVHSFTPVLDGEHRDADLGILYDPGRPLEASLAKHWQRALRVASPELRVRRNYPYRGRADGFTSYLRRRFPPLSYAGIELEANQSLLSPPARKRRRLWQALVAVLGTFSG